MSERDWNEGHRSAWTRVLRLAIGELRAGDEAAPKPEVEAARLLAEREDVVRVLRRVCAEHGDNEWPDTLHLGDVIEKHLERHLDDKS